MFTILTVCSIYLFIDTCTEIQVTMIIQITANLMDSIDTQTEIAEQQSYVFVK